MVLGSFLFGGNCFVFQRFFFRNKKNGFVFEKQKKVWFGLMSVKRIPPDTAIHEQMAT